MSEWGSSWIEGYSSAKIEAQDEILRLRAENGKLLAEIEEVKRLYKYHVDLVSKGICKANELRAENEKLRALSKEAQVTFDATWSEADLLRVENKGQRREIEKLREALKPFEIIAQWDAEDRVLVPVYIIRAAAAALKETESK